MQYNTQRLKLAIPEYGRHIQQMVDYCKSIPEKEKRNLYAKNIIELMGIMNPHLRDVPDFQHKLWDQLFIMSNFDIDVDSPYPTPSKEELSKKPQRLNYPQENYSHKYYGKNIRLMIQKAAQWEEGELKDLLILTLANQMKKSYIKYNRDQVDDRIIIQHLREISMGKINIKDELILMNSSLIQNNNKRQGHNKLNNNKKQNKTRKI